MAETIDIEGAAATLRKTYVPFKESGAFQEFLRKVLEGEFALSGYPVTSDTMVAKSSPVSLYLSAIAKAFYGVTSDPGRVTSDDRERVVLAVLASQGLIGKLAIHVYLGLMEKVPAVEIVDILFLSGVYSGVDRLSQSLEVANVVFLQVVEMGKVTPTPSPPDALTQIIAQFPEEKALLDRLKAAQ